MDRPKVGVGVIVIKDGRVIMQKRKNRHGNGTWSFPGGHMEAGESFEDCAKREVMEELGIGIANLRQGPFTNDIFTEEDKHYITIFMLAEYGTGEIRVMEPDVIEEWQLADWDDMPDPLFLPIVNLKKTGYRPK
jgi:8-oxo-dGTP diphosphatase